MSNMARVRDMRNIKNVEDEQVQNNGNHPHAMTDCEVNTSLDSYIENGKKVEEKKEEVKEEILISSKLDYAVLGATIANELENRLDIMEKFYKRLDDINDKYGQDSTSKSESDDDYVRFLESKVTRLEYEIAKLKGAK
jgi:hypothetical protein